MLFAYQKNTSLHFRILSRKGCDHSMLKSFILSLILALRYPFVIRLRLVLIVREENVSALQQEYSSIFLYD
jgi:hypothetical protein